MAWGPRGRRRIIKRGCCLLFVVVIVVVVGDGRGEGWDHSKSNDPLVELNMVIHTGGGVVVFSMCCCC